MRPHKAHAQGGISRVDFANNMARLRNITRLCSRAGPPMQSGRHSSKKKFKMF